MYCPTCGAGDQSAESYCRKCGQWLPDITALAAGTKSKTRGEMIETVRLLQAGSMVLALLAAVISVCVSVGVAGLQILMLAAFICLNIAAYQIGAMYYGYKLRQRMEQAREGAGREIEAGRKAEQLASAGGPVGAYGAGSVAEGTTRDLAAAGRAASRDKG